MGWISKMRDYFKISDAILLDQNIDASHISDMAVNHMLFKNYMGYVEDKEMQANNK